jgi:hypothetical protein
MATAREIDSNGYMTIKGCPVSSYGIFDYSAAQVGASGDPNRIVKVYRPKSALTDPEALASFQNLPFINNHEYLSGDKDSGLTAPEDYGIDGIMTGNVWFSDPWMMADLKVFSRQMQEDIETGKTPVSLGYACKFLEQSGTFEGQPYEFVQTNMRGNHIALVDEARVEGARVLDGLVFDHLDFNIIPQRGNSMAIQGNKKGKGPRRAMDSKSRKAMDNAVEQLKQLLPALQEFLSEEATEPAHQGGAEMGGSEADQEIEPAVPAASGEFGQEGEDEGEEGGNPLSQVIGALNQVISTLQGMAGQTGDEGEGKTEMDEETEKAEDEEESKEEKAEDEESTLGEGVPERIADEGEEMNKPAKGENSPAVGDAAFVSRMTKKIREDIVAADKLASRLSNVIGTFDSAKMDRRGVELYGVQKLKIKCSKGQEGIALDSYLTAVERTNAVRATAAKQTRAQDSATPNSKNKVGAYLLSASEE